MEIDGNAYIGTLERSAYELLSLLIVPPGTGGKTKRISPPAYGARTDAVLFAPLLYSTAFPCICWKFLASIEECRRVFCGNFPAKARWIPDFEKFSDFHRESAGFCFHCRSPPPPLQSEFTREQIETEVHHGFSLWARKAQIRSGMGTAVDSGFHSRYGWILDVEDEGLSRQLQKLSPEDLELLTLMVVDGCRQADIARITGCSRSAVSQHLKKIKKFLKST